MGLTRFFPVHCTKTVKRGTVYKIWYVCPGPLVSDWFLSAPSLMAGCGESIVGSSVSVVSWCVQIMQGLGQGKGEARRGSRVTGWVIQ